MGDEPRGDTETLTDGEVVREALYHVAPTKLSDGIAALDRLVADRARLTAQLALSESACDSWKASLREVSDALNAAVAAKEQAETALREISELTSDCDELSGGWLIGEKACAYFAGRAGKTEAALSEPGSSAADMDGSGDTPGDHESVGERQGRQPGSLSGGGAAEERDASLVTPGAGLVGRFDTKRARRQANARPEREAALRSDLLDACDVIDGLRAALRGGAAEETAERAALRWQAWAASEAMAVLNAWTEGRARELLTQIARAALAAGDAGGERT